MDGDGFDDLVFGERYKKLHVFRGASPARASAPDQTLVTPFFGDGLIAALGDVDGDGLADIAVEGSADAWYLFRGSSGLSPAHPVPGLRSSPSWTYRRSDTAYSLQVGGVGDPNGDGTREVLVGEYPSKLGQGTGSVVGFYSL